MQEIFTFLPIILPFLAIGLIFLVSLRKIISLEKKRLEKIKAHKSSRSVSTSLYATVKNGFRRSAESNIETNFSVIRKSLFVFFLIVSLLVLTLPFLESLPAQLISIVTTVFTVIIGIAAKPLIENVIAGIVITISGQFRIGQTVLIDDQYGTIEDISISHTTIKIWDWRRYIIPNVKMLSKEAINYALRDSYIWAKVSFWVSPNTDIRLVEKLAITAAKKTKQYWDIEEPQFWIMGIEKDSVECWVASWAKNPADAWKLKHQTRMNLLAALQKHGIQQQMLNISKQ